MKQMITIVSAKGNKIQKLAEVSADGKSASVGRKFNPCTMNSNCLNATFYCSNGDGTFRRDTF